MKQHMLTYSTNNKIVQIYFPLEGLRQKNFEKIAEGHNGSGWRLMNPDYATNIESFYNEYKQNNP
ncbi:hypothetical protein ACFPU0_25145 [Pseudomonas sp. GCM10022186]|uniref:hypothetical protein n=1 Tax=Pseudomonas sp. GCM10022186 TaxID=3252650 RepID=UPI00361B393A